MGVRKAYSAARPALYKAATLTRLPPAQPTESLPFLGRYQLQKKLAVGGMAELYLAHASGAGGFQKQVVVKRILPQLAESEELYQMFLDEARLAATLQHANIVHVYDACEDKGEFFMAMEYLDGTDLHTLRKVLAKSNMAIGWEHSLHIISSIASGLHYAHEKCALDGSPLRIVHRDVSPQNIFLTREGSVKLVDFGIAKAEGRSTETAMGTLKGKLGYMAPEQCTSDNVDRRSDIYSLGVILYELTTGRRLYSSKTEYQLMNEIVEGEIRPPSTFMDYPAELERIVLTCLQKDPIDRYETARDIQADLNVFARDYQLICSTLGFSIFIEPLLERARVEAEERWQHRKEISPIRVARGTKAVVHASTVPKAERDQWVPNSELSDPTPEPQLTPAPAQKPQVPPAVDAQAVNRADEIIEDFLSAKEQMPRRRRVRATSAPLPISTSYIQTGSAPFDDLTRPVPSDVLERIRDEERVRVQSDHDAAKPRLARGSFAEDVSVSAHVVRRDGQSNLLALEPLAEPKAKVAAEPEVSEAPIEFVNLRAPKVVDLKTPTPLFKPARSAPLPAPAAPLPAPAASLPAPAAAPAEESRIATELVAPTAFAAIDEADISIRPGRGKLWLGLGTVAGAAIAAAFLFGGSSDKVNAPPAVGPVETPEFGSLAVQASSQARVWLFLGKTPIQTEVIHGESSHLLRAEHDGYHGVEMQLGASSWHRDAKGIQFAEASFRLQPQESPLADSLTPQTQAPGDSTLPSQLRVSSNPDAADLWLYVGTTPDLQIEKLKIGSTVQLRITQEGRLPMYRSVVAEKFDAEGRARIHLVLPEAPSPTAIDPAPVGATEDEAKATGPEAATGLTAPKKRWRPKQANRGRATSDSKTLSHPVPEWAK